MSIWCFQSQHTLLPMAWLPEARSAQMIHDVTRCCFYTKRFLHDRVVSTGQNPQVWRAGRLLFVWPLTFDLSGMGDPTRTSRGPASIALRLTGARKPPPPRQGGNLVRGRWYILLLLLLLLLLLSIYLFIYLFFCGIAGP